jgi:hypothetical protein
MYIYSHEVKRPAHAALLILSPCYSYSYFYNFILPRYLVRAPPSGIRLHPRPPLFRFGTSGTCAGAYSVYCVRTTLENSFLDEGSGIRLCHITKVAGSDLRNLLRTIDIIGQEQGHHSYFEPIPDCSKHQQLAARNPLPVARSIRSLLGE